MLLRSGPGKGWTFEVYWRRDQKIVALRRSLERRSVAA
jgi:hypothetical protein